MATETKEYNWNGISASTVSTLKAPTVHEVPQPIIDLAQRSYDNKETLAVKLPSEAQAEAFVAHLRNVGPHVKPDQSSVAIHVDDEDKRTVKFRAGKKRGRQSV